MTDKNIETIKDEDLKDAMKKLAKTIQEANIKKIEAWKRRKFKHLFEGKET